MHNGPKIVTVILAIVLLFAAVEAYGQNTYSLLEGWEDGAWLGVSISDLTKAKVSELKLPDENGVLIDSVEKDSPAQKAGLHPNDVIVQFNGVKVLTTRQFTRMMRELLPDRTSSLVVVRTGAPKTIAVTLGKHPGSETNDVYTLNLAPFRKNLDELTERFHNWEGPQGAMAYLLEPRQGRLGVNIDSLTPQLGEYFGVKDGHGALITSVRKESPAEKAGLKAGDVIVGIDSKEVASTEDVMRMIRAKREGDLEIKVLRDRQSKSFTVHLEKSESESRHSSYRTQTLPRRAAAAKSII
ncbi:MAG: PDZ domain-containing protein [Acidobacteriia bacterium]|nr:PDZ domain-containing protein [Terriglobia bacterium]